MQNLFVFPELLYELFDPMLIEKCFLFRRIAAFVRQRDLEAGIKKRQLAQPCREPLKLKFGRDRKDRRIGQKRDECSGCLFIFDFTDDSEFVGRFALGKGHVINTAIAGHLHFEPFGKRVRAFRTHAV